MSIGQFDQCTYDIMAVSVWPTFSVYWTSQTYTCVVNTEFTGEIYTKRSLAYRAIHHYCHINIGDIVCCILQSYLPLQVGIDYDVICLQASRLEFSEKAMCISLTK